MSNNVGSDSEFRDGFLEGAARAFFVTAYADYVDDAPNRDEDVETFHAQCPAAGPGEDWDDIAPTTPPNAYALAGELWAKLDALNGMGGVYTLAERALGADHVVPDPEAFGFALAMQAMGHGVSWFDDHKRFPIVMPHVECHMMTFSDDAYRGAL